MDAFEIIFLMFSMVLITVVFVFLIRHSNQVLLQKIYDLEDRQRRLNKVMKHTAKNSSFNGANLVKKVEALEKKLAERVEGSTTALKAAAKPMEVKASMP